MVLDMGSQVSEVQETKGGKYIYCFRRKQLNERQKALMDVGGSLLDRSFSPGDFVVLPNLLCLQIFLVSLQMLG